MKRTIKARHGVERECKTWQAEAALRMLRNNLDPENAERPEDLVVYGGRRRARAGREALEAIERSLINLEEDETLLVQSGKPVAVFRAIRTHLGCCSPTATWWGNGRPGSTLMSSTPRGS